MNGETPNTILVGILMGIAGTVTMDLLGSLSRRVGLSVGAKGQWVGRWYIGIARGKFVHADITASPEQTGEMRAAFVGHYMIGIILAVFYVFCARVTAVPASSFPVAVGFGLATCVFPWFLLFPALGFGAFGRKGPSELKLLTSSLLNHFFYGLGLWLPAGLLPLG
jgi:hypothetical protein